MFRLRLFWMRIGETIDYTLFSRCDMYYESIDGWFDFQNVYDHAITLAQNGSHFVEVGAWLGRSTCYLAEKIKESGKEIRLDAIDTWKGSPNEITNVEVVNKCGGTILKEFVDSMNAAGVLTIVNPLCTTSLEAARMYLDNSLDFVFIDANHAYAEVRADIAAWYPKIKETGIIAGHDIPYPDVKRAVEESFGSNYSVVQPSSWMAIK